MAERIMANGSTETDADRWWAETVRGYERDGVPDELVRMARPLLESGNGKDQAAAHRLLQE